MNSTNKKKSNKLVRLIIAGVEQSFKSKIMIVLNIIMLVLAIGFVNFNTIKDMIKDKTSGNQISSSDIINISITQDDTGKFKNKLDSLKIENMKVSQSLITEEKAQNIEVKLIKDKEKILKITIISDEGIKGDIYNLIIKAADDIKKEVFSENKNLTKEEIASLTEQIEVERIINKIDNTLYDKYSVIITVISFTIYMLFIFIASSLASTIGMEKISKTTEYMLTGISQTAYLWFNILQVIIVLLLQALLSFIYFLIASMINTLLVGVTIGTGGLDLSILTTLVIDPTVISVILYSLFQIIVAIFILSIVQAVITSKSTNMSDIGNSTMLVILIAVICAFVLPNLIVPGEIVNIFIKIISLLPVLSCIMVPKLMLLGQINIVLVVLSIIISIITLIATTILGGRLFKRGLLNLEKVKLDSKTGKEKKEETLEERKFKNVISKVSIACILSIIISNTISFIIPIIFSMCGFVNSISTLIATIITFGLYIGVPYLYLKTSFNTNITNNKMKLKSSFKYIFIAIALINIFQYVITILMNITKIEFTGIDSNMISTDGTLLGNLLVIILVAVMPAIFEELLFRKGIISVTKKYGVWFSIILSSCIFGLVHGNIIQAIFALFTGIVLGFVYIKTGRIDICMIIHFINNLFGALALIMIDKEAILNNCMLVIGFIGIIYIILNLKNIKNLFKLPKIEVSQVRYGLIFKCISFIFMIAFYILMNIYVFKLLG